MSANTRPYHTVELTEGRRVWLNTLQMTWPAHPIYGLLEVDVTAVRRIIATQKNCSGEILSFMISSMADQPPASPGGWSNTSKTRPGLRSTG